jgi:predicted MFS family arabinose efflux permease
VITLHTEQYMRKLILMGSMLVFASSNLVQASNIDIALSRAEKQLNNVYWSIYPTLAVAAN